MIEFRNVSFAYEPGHKVLDGLSFRIEEGESVGLIGSNGAGKTTLVKALLGLVTAQGEILVRGLPVSRQNLAQIRKSVGYVLQNSDHQMFMPTVYEDMIFGPLNYGASREEAERRADETLRRLGIEELKHRQNHKLSGGEKRMAAIATTLAMRPEAIVMDEPTSTLDPFNRRMIIRTIRSLPQTRLIVSHDLDMILDTCERVLLLSGGKLAADGPAERILRDRSLLEENRLELPLSLSGTPGL